MFLRHSDPRQRASRSLVQGREPEIVSAAPTKVLGSHMDVRISTIASLGIDHYRIPLPVVPSDSTHGDTAGVVFEIIPQRK